MFRDAEHPSFSNQLSLQFPQREIVMFCTGSDHISKKMLLNVYQSLTNIGLSKNVLILADSITTCESISIGYCIWSSRFLRNPPSDSISIRKFWDFRFKFYYVRKKLLANLCRWNHTVIQADTDTYWFRNPFPILNRMSGSIIVQNDGPFANAGLIYVRPGSKTAVSFLDEMAWRIQLFQNHPQLVKRIVSFSQQPFYSNSDDQTILNDLIITYVLKNQTFLGSIARFEAKNGYNENRGPHWKLTAEYKKHVAEIQETKIAALTGHITDGSMRYKYAKYPISSSESLAIAPSRVFSHVTKNFEHLYVLHFAGVRGFASKIQYLKDNQLWHSK